MKLDARALGSAAALCLIGAVCVATLFGDGTEAPAGSSSSTGAAGRRAALLLLRKLDLSAEPWSGRPGTLPNARAVLFLSPAPTASRPESEATAEPARADPLRSGLRDPAHYRRFVERGGVLVSGLDEERSVFLAQSAGFGEIAGLSTGPASLSDGRARFEPTGEELALAARDFPTLMDAPARARALLHDGRGAVLAVEVPVGAGTLILFGADGFLSNASIDDADHALLLVRLVEHAASGAPVLFDEHRLGASEARPLFQLAFEPRALPFTLNLLAALSVLALWAAWPREFPRDPRPEERVSALTRSAARAALYLRAHRLEPLAQALARARLDDWARRWHVARRPGEAAHERLERVLAASGWSRADQAAAQRLCAPGEPANARELASLDQQLRAFDPIPPAGQHDLWPTAR